MGSNFLLVMLIVICLITDLRERKIYNIVLFPGLIAGLVLHMLTGGLYGLLLSVFGTGVGLGILLIPYLLGGMGAGDVKLLAVIGGIKGTWFVLMTSLYTALAGGIIALVVLLLHKGIKQKILHMVYFFHGLTNGVRFPIIPDEGAMKKTYPYGVAIAAGALYQAYSNGGFLK